MNSHNLPQFIALVTAAILVVIVLRHGHDRLKKLLAVYLVASAVWSFASFMANYDLPAEQKLAWAKWVALSASWAFVAYAHLATACARRKTSRLATAGYLYVIIVALLVSLGGIYRGLAPTGMVLATDYGYWLYFLVAGTSVFVVYTIFVLFRSYVASRNPELRNRIAYPLAGIGLLFIVGTAWWTIPGLHFPVAHIGLTCNILVVSYAVISRRPVDMRRALRTGVVYATLAVLIGAAFMMLLLGLQVMLQLWSASVSLALTIAVVVCLAVVFNPLKASLEVAADRLLYGRTYPHRRRMRALPGRIGSVIELEKLAGEALPLAVRAFRAGQASLLLSRNGQFVTRFAESMKEDAPPRPLELLKAGPVVEYLMRERRPLMRETIDAEEAFVDLLPEEKEALDAAAIEVLCPVTSSRGLVAILALGRKRPRGLYSQDDMDMLMKVASEAGIAMENAALYARAKERANTDELTGLYNHRYLHQRLDEEISRSSRFGEVFSLVLMDIDLFKTYNDISGHLAGDGVLKQIATAVKQSVRDADICFRYGGDEFAVIFPGTSLEDGGMAAERIRKEIESQMDLQGLPLTCSLGVATWPTDGVMREELVRAADRALRQAKNSGKNHTCMACEVTPSEGAIGGREHIPTDSAAVLNTIYALAATVDAKDHFTYGHSKKVSKYATEIAEALGYSSEDVKRVRVAALLHDIGKIGITDDILRKDRAPSPEEWEMIRTHPDLGVSIIRHIDSLKDCLAAVQYHHERYDGSGYPAGLKGSNIPLDARILAIADAYDAMISERPYREKGLSREHALDELINGAGTQFDPAIVEVFVGLKRPARTTRTVRAADKKLQAVNRARFSA